MFPDELVALIQKYQDDLFESTVNDISYNINEIIKSLKNVQNYLSNKLYDITSSDITKEDNSDEILADIKLLKQQIAYMSNLRKSSKTRKMLFVS